MEDAGIAGARAADVRRFGMFEKSFSHAGAYDNPYKELTAIATRSRLARQAVSPRRQARRHQTGDQDGPGVPSADQRLRGPVSPAASQSR